jgi:hypothetical protein
LERHMTIPATRPYPRGGMKNRTQNGLSGYRP